MKVCALEPHKYARQFIKAGEVYEAKPKDAKVLIFLGKVEKVADDPGRVDNSDLNAALAAATKDEPEPEPEMPSDVEEAKPRQRRTYRRRDLTAEKPDNEQG